jgi:uncharacterized membrane protein YhaH (DUF805 family)
MSNNPYQTPTGQLQTEDDQAFGEVSFFSPSGRLNRLRYWAHGMVITIPLYVAMIAGIVLILQGTMFLGGAIIAVSYIAMLVFSFIIVIQRLHDLNKSGWLSLLMLVPLANIYLIVLVIFFKGTPGRNNYGLQTPPNKTWHWIMAFSFPVLIVIAGIIAAISIPAYQDAIDGSRAAQEEVYDSETSTSDEYYYEEQTTDDTQSIDTEATDGDYSESENYESDAEAELESMTEDETSADEATEETPAQ